MNDKLLQGRKQGNRHEHHPEFPIDQDPTAIGTLSASAGTWALPLQLRLCGPNWATFGLWQSIAQWPNLAQLLARQVSGSWSSRRTAPALNDANFRREHGLQLTVTGTWGGHAYICAPDGPSLEERKIARRICVAQSPKLFGWFFFFSLSFICRPSRHDPQTKHDIPCSLWSRTYAWWTKEHMTRRGHDVNLARLCPQNAHGRHGWSPCATRQTQR